MADADAAVDQHQHALGELADHRAELARLQVGRRTVDEDMLCPISCELMKEPVVAADGNTYERVCIEQWFATGARTSPVTNAALTSTHLLPNHTVRRMIAAFLERCRAAGAAPVGT